MELRLSSLNFRRRFSWGRLAGLYTLFHLTYSILIILITNFQQSNHPKQYVIDTGSIILDQTEVFIVSEINYGMHNFTNEASNISPNILSLSYATSNKHRCSTRKIQPCIWTILLLSGDIEINPGSSKYPCGICKWTVASNHRAISAMTVMTGFTSDVGILHLLNTTDYNQ